MTLMCSCHYYLKEEVQRLSWEIRCELSLPRQIYGFEPGLHKQFWCLVHHLLCTYANHMCFPISNDFEISSEFEWSSIQGFMLKVITRIPVGRPLYWGICGAGGCTDALAGPKTPAATALQNARVCIGSFQLLNMLLMAINTFQSDPGSDYLRPHFGPCKSMKIILSISLHLFTAITQQSWSCSQSSQEQKRNKNRGGIAPYWFC